jgi:hypothetical protein
MTLRYYARHERLFTEYVGQRKGIEDAEPLCQRIPGADIDRVVGDILPELVNPVNLEIALTLQQELQSRLDQSDRLRRQHVERARYEAELAQRRYMRVDPQNRLWPILWRPTGIRNSERLPTLSRSTNNDASRIGGCSMTSNGRRSSGSRKPSYGSGKIRLPRTAIASA